METIRLAAIVGVFCFFMGMLVQCNCGKTQRGYMTPDKSDSVTTITFIDDTCRHEPYEPTVNTVLVPQPFVPDGYVKLSDIPAPEEPREYTGHDSSYVEYLIRIKDAYFSKVFYSDSIKTPFATIYLEDSLYRNRITSRKPTIVTHIPHTTTSIFKEPEQRTMFYAGGIASYRTDTTLALGLSTALKFKNNSMLGLDAMFDNRLRLGVNLSFLKPLSLRRKK